MQKLKDKKANDFLKTERLSKLIDELVINRKFIKFQWLLDLLYFNQTYKIPSRKCNVDNIKSNAWLSDSMQVLQPSQRKTRDITLS